MPDYGRTVAPSSTGIPIQLAADGNPDWKRGGISVDWNTVAAVGADTLLPEGVTVAAGRKYLRYGQVLTKITAAATDVLTETGTVTGGTFTVSVTAGGSTQTTAAQAYNVAAATLQTAIQGLSNVGSGNATVTGSAGGPYTVTFAAALGQVTTTVNGAALTGTNPGMTATASSYGNIGRYGPYDTAAVDGRQTLTRGACYLLNQTVLELGMLPSLFSPDTTHPAVLEGGNVWLARLIATTGTHSLANGPTFAELEAVLPRLQYVQS